MGSWKQAERQDSRDTKGRYTEVNHCEYCKKAVGVDYFSAPDCSETGKGVCLCEKCAIKAEENYDG